MTKKVWLKSVFVAGIALLSSSLSVTGVNASTNATDVSAGATHACAIVEDNVKCWGNNSNGQLGNGSSAVSVTSPVDVVSKKAWTETIPKSQQCVLIFCKDIAETKVNHPAIGLEGRNVTKVSAGVNHSCAIADAKLFCWGNNSNGQLGNNKAGLTQETTPVAVSVENGVLKYKEIVDVATGDEFTCALASDSTLACWGKNNYGQLGINARGAKKVPTKVYSGEGSALLGKKALKLASVNGVTMCVIAVPQQGGANETDGVPVCWGHGIDDGSQAPANSYDVVTCGKNSPSSMPKNRSETNYFSSYTPRLIDGAKVSVASGNKYMTGLAKDGRAYYWGMYGYTKNTSYSNIDSCTVDCKGKVTIMQSSENRDDYRTIGLYESSVILAGMKRVSPGTGDRGANKEYRKDSCDKETHYGYTESIASFYVGQKSTTLPQETSITKGVKIISGSINEPFCAVMVNGIAACDAYGSDATDGRTGSGYVKQCTKNGWITTCLPQPTGPQNLSTNDWLMNKVISRLSTSSTGYTCAIASGSVGCWGQNNRGQLGVGDTAIRNVPVGVRL